MRQEGAARRARVAASAAAPGRLAAAGAADAGRRSRGRCRPSRSAEDPIAARDIGDINKNSPFQPVFFAFDSSDVDAPAQQALNANAEIMKKYPSWVITIEGHADERGTAEYNLALGERRAMSARTYLVSLGLPADRLRTVSYGKEFPFDPGHDEAAWAKNRRAQFVLTSK